MHEVIMPKLGLTMESGRIEKWHKKEGDRVEVGEVLFEVMTDKVTIEVESYNEGILLKILKSEGEEVPVTEVVAYIGEKNEKVPQSGLKQKAVEKNQGAGVKETSRDMDEARKIPGISKKRVSISPLARRTAEKMGIDYSREEITGSGPGGRIVKEDIIAYSKIKQKTKKEAAVSSEAIVVKSSARLTGLRKVIAERMVYSKSTIPHIVLNAKADVTKLTDLKEKLKEELIKKYNIKITYTDFVLKAAATALRKNLEVNSTFSDENYIIYDEVNVGLAISVEGGLMVPTIFNCDKLEIIDIARKRIELLGKAGEGKLSLEEISNGTFTVTNLGMYGIRSFSPIINPPQAAILAVGEIYTEPVLVGGKAKPGFFMNLSVSCDHRIIDGAIGAGFLKTIVGLLKYPEKLIG